MALAPRKPQPNEFADGEKDPAFQRAIIHWKQQWEEKRKQPELWGGRSQPVKSQAPQQPPIQ